MLRPYNDFKRVRSNILKDVYEQHGQSESKLFVAANGIRRRRSGIRSGPTCTWPIVRLLWTFFRRWA